MKFNERLKQLRLEREWFQRDLAKKIGVGRTTIGRYEAGEISPDIEKLIELSNIFDCSLDYLLGKSNVKNAPDLCQVELDPDKPITAKDLDRLMDYLKKKIQE
jgi:transcriptional regulator with XRE-family HTH domain